MAFWYNECVPGKNKRRYKVSGSFSFTIEPIYNSSERAAFDSGAHSRHAGRLSCQDNQIKGSPFAVIVLSMGERETIGVRRGESNVPGSPCGVMLARDPKARTSHQAHTHYSINWVSRVTEFMGK